MEQRKSKFFYALYSGAAVAIVGNLADETLGRLLSLIGIDFGVAVWGLVAVGVAVLVAAGGLEWLIAKTVGLLGGE